MEITLERKKLEYNMNYILFKARSTDKFAVQSVFSEVI